MIMKATLKSLPLAILMAGLTGNLQANPVCYENCHYNAVTYEVETYEDKHNFCGYDVEGAQQVCVDAQVVQVDTKRITRIPGDGSMTLKADTVSDVKYTSRVSFDETM